MRIYNAVIERDAQTGEIPVLKPREVVAILLWVRIARVMRQLILNNVDIETAERLELRAKRLGTTPEEAVSRLLREQLRMDSEVAIVEDLDVVLRRVVIPVPSRTVDVFEFIASATAILEHVDVFLTGDRQLEQCKELAVEVIT